MKKIRVWTNFCPKKMYWELKQLPDFSKQPEQWWESSKLLKEQLKLLKKSGITGLRLNIFNTELTENAQTIHWQPLEIVLDLAEQLGLEIHLCLGPYQYPLWPGIRIPSVLLNGKKHPKIIDHHKKWKEFGLGFLEEQLKRYGKHKVITGFYLGNEWHTDQRIEDHHRKNDVFVVSQKHMESLARICKKHTRKPILFNTNFQPHQQKKLEHTFLPLIKILKNQSWIGFDVYPSQENLLKSPGLFIHRKMSSFAKDLETVKKKFMPRLLISEFEAQPWGNGKSWYEQITRDTNLIQKSAEDLQKSFTTFISPSAGHIDQVTLWGAEYWLVAHYMNNPQLLETVATLAK